MKNLFKFIVTLSIISTTLIADDICYEAPYVDTSNIDIDCDTISNFRQHCKTPFSGSYNGIACSKIAIAFVSCKVNHNAYKFAVMKFPRVVLPIKSISNGLKDVEVQYAIKGFNTISIVYLIYH